MSPTRSPPLKWPRFPQRGFIANISLDPSCSGQSRRVIIFDEWQKSAALAERRPVNEKRGGYQPGLATWRFRSACWAFTVIPIGGDLSLSFAPSCERGVIDQGQQAGVAQVLRDSAPLGFRIMVQDGGRLRQAFPRLRFLIV